MRAATAAADWAANAGGNYPGLCDHFVGLAYGHAHSGFEHANAHWDQTPSKSKHPGDTKPPVGALVFFDTGKVYGHVAIVSGYDKSGRPLITTTHANGGKPTVMTLGQIGMSYKGWAEPYFAGKVQKLDPQTAGTPRAAGSKSGGAVVDPTDESGVDTGQAPPPDPLSMKELADQYGYAWRVIKSVPELKKIFKEAFNDETGQWTTQKFTLAVKDSKWYKQNADYARKAWVAEKTGGADWKAQVQEARLAVQKRATALGAAVNSEILDDLAHRYISEGWGEAEREQLLDSALSEAITVQDDGMMLGSAGDLQDKLMKIANDNGLKYDTAFYQSAARSVAAGLSTDQDWEREMRSKAASMWPPYRDQILAGVDARYLASGYINKLAEVMEMDPYTLDLNDPRIRQAMTGVDAQGNPKPVGLWEFEQSLRADPKWMDTKKGQDQVSSVGAEVLRKMGFMS